jgi:hypothetical protein
MASGMRFLLISPIRLSCRSAYQHLIGELAFTIRTAHDFVDASTQDAAELDAERDGNEHGWVPFSAEMRVRDRLDLIGIDAERAKFFG